MRLSYTNVTATLALFLALGGTSYAAATLTGADVRNGTVTGADLRSQSVKGRDIDNGSLTGSDLRNGSLTTSDLASLAADFTAGQLPAGPQGPPGTTKVLTRRRAEVPLRSGDARDLIASCLRARSQWAAERFMTARWTRPSEPTTATRWRPTARRPRTATGRRSGSSAPATTTSRESTGS
jgi:hypothetical protein